MGSIVDLEKRARPSWPKELSTNEDKVLNAEEINTEMGSKKEAPQNTDVGSKKEAPQNTEVGSKKEGPSAGGFDLHTSAKDKCTPRELECTSAGSTRHGTGYDLLTLDEDWTQTAWLARTSVVPIRKGGGHWMKRFLLSC